jgi:uncharacterized membrane protein YfcA
MISLEVILKLLLTGASAGLAAGFLGIGGGAILTPLCLVIFPAIGVYGDELLKVIFGTNMLLVTVFSFSAVALHHSSNMIDWGLIKKLGPLSILGSITGALTASVADTSILRLGFAVILVFASVMIFLRNTRYFKPKNSTPILKPSFLPLVGLTAGFIGSFLGLGGGVVIIPVLILLFHYPVERVAPTSSSLIIFTGLTGTIAYMFQGNNIELPGISAGYVWLSAAIPIMLGGVPLARVGAWLNLRTGNAALQKFFAALLLVIGIKILFF